MPPTTSAQEPLKERVLKLAQTLQFAWFGGHVTLLLTTLRYALSYLTLNYYSRWAQFSYRTAFLAAAITYSIVVYKGYRARAKGGKGQLSPLSMAGDENVQYLVMALVWLFASQTPLAMLPFAVYSVFHVATYTRGMLIPILQNPSAGGSQPSALSNAIGRFVKDYYDASMSVVAALEIALWFRLLFSALLFQRGSWILLVIYSVFVRARITQSSFVQGVIRHLGTRGDALAARQDVPPAARNAWVQMKGVAGKAHDATDVQRYVSTNAPAVKKSS